MSSHCPLALIVVMGENGAIGRDNRLLWALRTDMRRFRALTMGHPVIMGRRTWESIGAPLPGRDAIVLSRDPAFQAEGVQIARDLDAARALATISARQRGVDRIMVAGGSEIYAAALPLAERVYLTLVHDRPAADAFFPGGADGAWRRDFRETWSQEHQAGPHDERSFAFIDLERVGAGGR